MIEITFPINILGDELIDSFGFFISSIDLPVYARFIIFKNYSLSAFHSINIAFPDFLIYCYA